MVSQLLSSLRGFMLWPCTPLQLSCVLCFVSPFPFVIFHTQHTSFRSRKFQHLTSSSSSRCLSFKLEFEVGLRLQSEA